MYVQKVFLFVPSTFIILRQFNVERVIDAKFHIDANNTDANVTARLSFLSLNVVVYILSRRI